jgi:signal recognition particle subunit SEC65
MAESEIPLQRLRCTPQDYAINSTTSDNLKSAIYNLQFHYFRVRRATVTKPITPNPRSTSVDGSGT